MAEVRRGGTREQSDPGADALASAPTVASHEGLAETLESGGAGPARVGGVLGDRYELIAELGRGAFGVVYRARDRVADEMVAIKVLSAGESSKAMARLRRELKSARTVTHAGVVRIHDVMEIGGRLALSMELVEGETLSARLAHAPPLCEAEIKRLALDLARGLAAAHRAGVVHRDLKPANIILRAATGRPVITDFGISRLVPTGASADGASAEAASAEPQLTREGELVGTPLYMAPEQLVGSADVGPAADVYALGVVLYEAASGTRPHATAILPDLVSARLTRPAPPLASLRPDLDGALCAVVDRCLAVRAADRFADGAQVRAALEPGVSTATGPIPLAPRRPRRRWLFVAAGALALAAAAGALVHWQRGQLPARDRRVVVQVLNGGGADDAWLARAVEAMAPRRLRDRAPRLRVVDDPSRANVAARLVLRRSADGASLSAEVGRVGGRLAPLGTVSAPSIAGALDQTLQRLGGRLAAGQHERGPDEAERAEMASLGAASLPAFRLYQQAIDHQFATITSASGASRPAIEEAIRLDPGWAHARVLHAIILGSISPPAEAALRRAREECTDPARDPLGRKLLEAMELSRQGRHADAGALLAPVWRQAPRDIAAGWLLLVNLYGRQRTDEVIGVLRQLHEAYPDLQFGSDLAAALRQGGRADEVAALLDAWFARAPHSEQALIAQVARDLERQNPRDAERRARDLVLLHGDAPHRLIALCDVLIMVGRTREARGLADRLLQGSARDRSYGRFRLGVVAVSEGRFAAAYESLQEAAAEARPLGLEGEIEQILDALRLVAPLVGRQADVERQIEELGKVRDAAGVVGDGAVARFEGALLQRRAAECPDLGAALARLPEGPARTVAGIDMQRAAAEAGCLPCSTVVGAGLSSAERGAVSLYRFGACAEREGALRLALEGFTRVRAIPATSLDSTSRPSVYHAVLALYHLGRVHERLGDRAAARAALEAFLGHWGKADRLVPQAEEARTALARLR